MRGVAGEPGYRCCRCTGTVSAAFANGYGNALPHAFRYAERCYLAEVERLAAEAEDAP